MLVEVKDWYKSLTNILIVVKGFEAIICKMINKTGMICFS